MQNISFPYIEKSCKLQLHVCNIRRHAFYLPEDVSAALDPPQPIIKAVLSSYFLGDMRYKFARV